MILLLGLLDVFTAFITFFTINWGLHENISILLLLFLGLKGAWTLYTIRKIDPLGLLDLLTAIISYYSITTGSLTNVAVVGLALVGFKGLSSVLK